MRTTFLLAILAAFAVSAAPRAQAPVEPPAGYAWAGACKKCHEPIYDAWARTKHATALQRLSGAEQGQPCVACHVTGAKTRVFDDGGKLLNAGVQCEGCHGPGAAHVADPSVKTGLVRTPPESTCTACHSDKSPHFRGFWYGAMKPVVHMVR